MPESVLIIPSNSLLVYITSMSAKPHHIAKGRLFTATSNSVRFRRKFGFNMMIN